MLHIDIGGLEAMRIDFFKQAPPTIARQFTMKLQCLRNSVIYFF